MRVLVGGGTGFIGTAVTQLLRGRGHEVKLVSRQPGPGRITWSELSESGLPLCDVVINLAGENILNPLRRWNETFQKEVLTSRLDTTHLLAKAITETAHPPQAWILVTGVGQRRLRLRSLALQRAQQARDRQSKQTLFHDSLLPAKPD
uniref:Short chain dehydrogenase/reductase family 39U, member 1 n=1 Tax=Mus musculus TaxID=10090 RepID=A0A2I3BRL7_MOUSE